MMYRRYALGSALTVLLLTQAAPADAQPARRTFRNGPHTALGYAGAFPDAEVGAGFMQFVGTRGLGLFGEVKKSMENVKDRYNFCPAGLERCDASFVVAERNDRLLQTPEEWLIFNGGGIVSVTDELALVVGAGMGRQTVYREYLDVEIEEELRLTPDGTYYVTDEAADGWRAQGVAGVLLRAGSLVFRFGYETAPGAASVGVLMFVR